MKYLILFLPLLLFSQTSNKWINNVRLYMINTGTATLSWDPIVSASSYDIRETWWDPTPELVYDLGSTTTTSFIINRRRAGHFFYEVRACNYDINNVKQCSDWASSLNITTAQLHDNGLGTWLIYWRLPSPGPIIIE